METILLINSANQLKYYDLNEVRRLGSYRLIALMGSEQAGVLSSEMRASLDAVYFAETQVRDGIPGLDVASIPGSLLTELGRASEAKSLHIVSTSNEYSCAAAQLRTRYGVAGRTAENITPYWNKAAAKRALNAKGIRCPRGTTVSAAELEDAPVDSFSKLCTQLSLPFILKPLEAAGCVGTTKVSTESDFQKWLNAKKVSDLYEAEEYIEGTLFHCDSIVQDARVVVSFCWEYAYPNLMFLSGKPLGSIAMTEPSPLRERIERFTHSALEALGMVDGSSHMEIFRTTSDELVFLEAGPRPPGTVIMSCYERVYGIKFMHLDLLVSLGLPVVPVPRAQTNGFWVVWPRLPGLVKEFRPPRLHIEALFEPLIKEGARLEASVDIREQSCRMLAHDPDYQRVRAAFDDLKNNYHPLTVM